MIKLEEVFIDSCYDLLSAQKGLELNNKDERSEIWEPQEERCSLCSFFTPVFLNCFVMLLKPHESSEKKTSQSQKKRFCYRCNHLTTWQQQRLTKCLKCTPTAWTGRSSRRGSSLEEEGGERKWDTESIMVVEEGGMCWLPPPPSGLDHQIKDKQTSLWGRGANVPIWEQWVSNMAEIQGGEIFYLHIEAQSLIRDRGYISAELTIDVWITEWLIIWFIANTLTTIAVKSWKSGCDKL